jgi:hypothetical protein
MTGNPDWMEGIKPESLDKAVQAGEILPQLALPVIPPGKTNSDETLFVKFLELPRKITGENIPNGVMWVATVEHQGAKKNLIIPGSLRFNMAKECKLNELESPTGHWFVIGAHFGETKYGSQTKLYWCQYKKRQLEEAESFEQAQRESQKSIKESPNPPNSIVQKEEEASASPSSAQIQKDAESFMDIDLEKTPEEKKPLPENIPQNSTGKNRKQILALLRKKGDGFSREDMLNELKNIGLTKEQSEDEIQYWVDIGTMWEMSPGIFKII